MSLGLNCNPESMECSQSQCAIGSRSFGTEMGLWCCQRPGEVASTLDLHRVFQSSYLENMAMVYWIRHVHLCMIEPQEVRLSDDRHACWKKRQQKSAGACASIHMSGSYLWIIKGCSNHLNIQKRDSFLSLSLWFVHTIQHR